jgi:hypothetical protein
LVEEAGGIISDYLGRPLDFGLGRTLGRNFGVVAARREVHAWVIEAIQAVLAESATPREGVESASVRLRIPLLGFSPLTGDNNLVNDKLSHIP